MTQQKKLKEQYGAFFDEARCEDLLESVTDPAKWIVDHIPQLLEDWSQAKFDAAMVEEMDIFMTPQDELPLCGGWNQCRSEIIKRWNSQE